jgi:hypothetical protein
MFPMVQRMQRMFITTAHWLCLILIKGGKTMLTKNYYLKRRSLFMMEEVSGGVDYTGAAFKAYSGSTSHNLSDNNASYFNNWELGYAMKTLELGAIRAPDTYMNNCFMCLGSGTTPATINDYCMENQITSGLTQINDPTVIRVLDDGGVSYISTFVVQNTSEKSISISEFGMFGNSKEGTSSSSTNKMFMTEHTVLDEPIIIEPGQMKCLQYVVRFSNPNL